MKHQKNTQKMNEIVLFDWVLIWCFFLIQMLSEIIFLIFYVLRKQSVLQHNSHYVVLRDSAGGT